ncbi:MAG TPA: SigB/SigF/SigG family RNA polymerase sigma factor [Acidimicrobiia bacterium]|jgi:RNA polymerase sigma-B factor
MTGDRDGVARQPADELRREFVEYRRTGDRRLRNKLVERHVPLAEHLARRFAGRSERQDDLTQVALLGLLKAVERFEPERGLAFSTFATPTILGELKRHFRDAGWSVRMPRQLQEHVLEVTKSLGPLTQRLGRAPTIAEIAAETMLPHEAVIEAMEANRAFTASSIEAPSDDDDALAPLDALGRAEPGMEHVEHQLLVSALLDTLPPRERAIVVLRFRDGMTQSQIATRLDMSQMHVSRLLARTLARLRTLIEAEEHV